MTIRSPLSNLVWPLKIILLSTGSYPKYKVGQRVGTLLVIIGYILVLYSTLSLGINSTDLMATDSLSILTLFFLTFFETLAIRLHRNIFFRAMNSIENESNPEVVKIANKRFIGLLIFAFEVIIVIEGPYESIGIIMALFLDTKMGTPESLIYPMYVPWRYDTKLKYILVLLWQVLTAIQPILIGYGIVATFCAIFAHVDAKYQLLLASIENLENIKSRVVLHNGQIVTMPVDDFVYSSSLHQVIKDHQIWKSVATEVISFVADWSGIILCCVTSCSIFVVTNVEQAGIPIHLKIKNASLFICIFAHLFMVSFLGEYFQNTNDKIRDAIYNVSWYTKSTKVRKTITTFQLQTQRSLTVKAYGMISVNMSLILTMVRIIYSMSNLYRNTYRYKFSE